MKQLFGFLILIAVHSLAFAKSASVSKDDSFRKRKVTIVFTFDFSLSMNTHIKAVTAGFKSFVDELENSQCAEWEVGVGRMDAESGFEYFGPRRFPAVYSPDANKYSKDVNTIYSLVEKLKNFGEGNGQEVPVDALNYILEQEGHYFFTRDYTALVILTDALEYRSKAVAEDVISAAKNIGKNKVGVYHLGIDPDLVTKQCYFDQSLDWGRIPPNAGREFYNSEYRSLGFRPPFSVEEIVRETDGGFVHMCGKDMNREMKLLARSIANASCQFSSL